MDLPINAGAAVCSWTEYELHYFQMNGGLEEFYRFLEERSLDRERGGRQGTTADSGMEALWQRWPGTQMSWADQMVLEELRGWYGSEEGDGAGALEEYREVSWGSGVVLGGWSAPGGRPVRSGCAVPGGGCLFGPDHGAGRDGSGEAAGD